MKFCTKCGNQMADDSVFCSVCGTQVAAPQAAPQQQTYQQPYAQPAPYQQAPYQQAPYGYVQPVMKPETPGLATCAVVFAILIPLVGFILGIIGNKKYTFPKYKNRSKAAIWISLGVWILNFLILTVLNTL